jgi:hypothetical protein
LTVTRRTYRHQLADVVTDAAEVMDRIFPAAGQGKGGTS